MKQDKILGAFVGAAIGDAMGTPLESRPVYLIKETCGNGDFVRDYIDMPAGSFAPDMKKGMVSDDFSLAFATAKAAVKHGGISTAAVEESLLDWKNGALKEYAAHYMGATTGSAIRRLEGAENPDSGDKFTGFQKTMSNGAAMKAWVPGVLNAGDVDGAVADALLMGQVTHNNVIALGGACAVAAGTACAMLPGADVAAIVEAGLYGARVGQQKALEVAGDAPGASVEKRIRLAVKIGLQTSHDFAACVNDMTDLVGTGLFTNEAVPAAFGFLVSAGGDVMETIFRAINAGNDCDTVATMAGAMAGAFKGHSAIPAHHLPYLSEVNHMDIAGMAEAVAAMV